MASTSKCWPSTRAADLLVVSQFDARGLDIKLRLHIAERLILTAGVPVMVLPTDFEPQVDFDHAMIAWNSSRESVRAVRDNLDLLRGAGRITALAAGGSDETGRTPLEQLQAFLGRHDIQVELERNFGDTLSAGDIILRQAADIGADLIVMGALAAQAGRKSFWRGDAPGAGVDGSPGGYEPLIPKRWYLCMPHAWRP